VNLANAWDHDGTEVLVPDRVGLRVALQLSNGRDHAQQKMRTGRQLAGRRLLRISDSADSDSCLEYRETNSSNFSF